jgi:hypothetical protein
MTNVGKTDARNDRTKQPLYRVVNQTTKATSHCERITLRTSRVDDSGPTRRRFHMYRRTCAAKVRETFLGIARASYLPVD